MRCDALVTHERALKTTERPELRTGLLQCAMQGSPAKVAGAARSEKYERRKTSRDNHGLGRNKGEGGRVAGKPVDHHRLISRQKREGQNVRRNQGMFGAQTPPRLGLRSLAWQASPDEGGIQTRPASLDQ